MRPKPPLKVVGRKSGPRRINGAAWDVATAARELGESEKAIRNQIARGLLPYKRRGGRIILLPEEVRDFLRQLPGVTAAEALHNIAARNGGQGT